MQIDYMNSNAVRLFVYCGMAFLIAITPDVNAGRFSASTMIAGGLAAGIAYKAFRSIPKPSSEEPVADPVADPFYPQNH